MEEADVVFSLEQTCQKPKPKAEKLTVLEEEEEEKEEEEDSDMEESSTATLFLKIKENPEELMQLAPHSGDTIISLRGARNHAFQQNRTVCD